MRSDEKIEAIEQGLTNVFSPGVFPWIFLGVIVGLVVGILPGLGGGAMLAICPPLIHGVHKKRGARSFVYHYNHYLPFSFGLC